MTESVRLSKYLAAHFSCSRREAENYVQGGWVRVDGVIVEEPGVRIEPHQKVELAQNARSEDHKPATILLHKPAGYGQGTQSVLDLTTALNLCTDDRSGRHFVKADLRGIEVFLPLGIQASGLLILTQEYGIARKLTADADRIEQEYVVDVEGELPDEGLKRLNHGLSWQGSALPAAKVSWQSETRLRFALKHSQADRVIADMCAQVGLKVLSLKRLRIGRLSMAGLPVGQWRYLLGYERF